MLDVLKLAESLDSTTVEVPFVGTVRVRCLSAYEIAEIESVIDRVWGGPGGRDAEAWTIGRGHRADLLRLAVAAEVAVAVDVEAGDGEGNKVVRKETLTFTQAEQKGVLDAWALAAVRAVGAATPERLAPIRQALRDVHQRANRQNEVDAAKKP